MYLFTLRLILILEVSAILLGYVSGATPDDCNRYETCKDCIRQQLCSWCSQRNFANDKRCFSSSALSQGVSCDSVTNPENSVLTKKGTLGASYDGRKLSDLKEGEVPRLIQITPLEVNLTLRPNVEETIKVKFKLSKDYPLDLYYLTDSSYTMNDSMTQVANESAKISRVMGNITKNFRLGCGKFADKPVRPFNYYYKDCEQRLGVCSYLQETKTKRTSAAVESFADVAEFQNLMPLRANSSQFRDIMINITLDGNQDDPEGGLSALMQVIVCKEAIGWRDNSNRLVVYSSDSEYHQAGEGKLGGIVRPNDGHCHLDGEGYYTHASVMDYPSVSHINHMATKHNTKIIFAITNPSAYNYYKELIQGIKDSSFVELKINSSSVVDLIETEYRKIISHVGLNDTSSEFIDVKYRASCSEGAPFIDRQRCENLKIGSEVNFEVTFKLKECPPDGSARFERFEISPSGMNESISVNVEMICECACEKEGAQENAKECNGAGVYQCGICRCNENYSGWNCECLNSREQSNMTSSCVQPGNDTLSAGVECNGNGFCQCGKCQCHDKEHISGPYCNCDNRACRKRNSLVCNGHGLCDCSGTCVCHTHWTHAAPDTDPVCDCPLSVEACLTPVTSLVCGGHGTCRCGECVCQDGFGGVLCQEPPLNLAFCKELETCVECLAYQTGPKVNLHQKTNCSAECAFELIFEINKKSEEKGMQCYSKDINGCMYQFIYYYEDMKLTVRGQKERPKCEKIDLLKYILTTTAIGLLVGVLSLVAWKLATMTFDRLEYMKFMKEQERANWDSAGNPLYRAPTTTIQNPMFQTDS